MDEDMVSTGPIEFYSEEEFCRDCIDSYQRQTFLTDVVQTCIGQLKCKKITYLIKYDIDRSLQLVMVCATGGARRRLTPLSVHSSL
ncbi:hypothetical protein AMTRI_Chr06g197480 [Amborella trichopoda]